MTNHWFFIYICKRNSKITFNSILKYGIGDKNSKNNS